MTDQKKLENCDSASAKETCFNYAERKQFIQKLFRQHYRSKDVVHDIFAHLLRESQDLREETAEHYLLTCVRNRCLNMIRSRKIQERVEHLYLLDLETTILPTQCLDEELKALQKGIAQLDPPICQDIIMQHFRDGVTFKEIAFRLGVSETTVYKHLRRALHQLRTHLNNK